MCCTDATYIADAFPIRSIYLVAAVVVVVVVVVHVVGAMAEQE
jgi:hypothetical protein